MANEAITERNKDFAQWYTDVVRAAKLCDYSSVKGCMVIEPNGYAIWEKMQEILDKKFKELGHVNVQLPLFIPESLLKKVTKCCLSAATRSYDSSCSAGRNRKRNVVDDFTLIVCK